jgi:hypothetical protein
MVLLNCVVHLGVVLFVKAESEASSKDTVVVCHSSHMVT